MKKQRDGDRDGEESTWPDSAWKSHFRRQLLSWFRKHARDLPWRPSPGLYATWISETMLQQTQVVTVIPYYTRFLQQFPDVCALAAANEQDVLRLWEGLGYYRRARHLHAAARQVVAEFEGRMPTAIDELRSLPGIGRYTAGAILSIALDQRHPILEANSTRVLSRLLALEADPTRGDSQRRLWAFAAALLPRRRCGDFNQALMELGSKLCTPRAPHCELCPVAVLCPTQQRGLHACIPAPKSKTPYVNRREAAIVVRRADRCVLLRQCPHGERWAGLWDFPRVEWSGEERGVDEHELRTQVAALTGVSIGTPHRLTTLHHGVTRYRITLACFVATCRRAGRTRPDIRWVPPHDLAAYPLNTTARRIARLLSET